MDQLDRFLGHSAAALQVQARRLDLIASNIANAATPNYRARDIDFAAALSTAGAASGRARPVEAFRVPMLPARDGNTVEMATEQIAFAEAGLRYRTSLGFLGSRIGTLMSALKGDGA